MTSKIVTAPKTANRRIFVATGVTGLVRAEWAMARWNQASPVNWSKLTTERTKNFLKMGRDKSANDVIHDLSARA